MRVVTGTHTDPRRSTLAFVTSLAWAGLAEIVRWLALQKQQEDNEAREIEEAGKSWMGSAIAAMNPWDRKDTVAGRRASVASSKLG